MVSIMKDISIIIVNYRGWNRLTKCLEALNSFQGKSFNDEVIVVDNKSDDDTIYKIKEQFPKFRFISNGINGGFANGCNVGSRDATGEFLLFLNPDTVASESEIEKLLDTAKQNPDHSILSCRQVNENGKENIASGAFPNLFNLTGFQRAILRSWKPGNGNQKTEISFPDWISGSVILIRK
ncbi:MAG: glycosyltransferase, partial [Bacteroidetes bacterium]